MRKNPIISFIFPNFHSGNLDYHLGANYIIAYLRSKGIYAEQFINKSHISLLELVNLVLEREPRIIGFTCFDSNHYLVKRLSQEIKKKCPHILIITGGPTPTFSDRDLMEDIPEVDICVRGEGEYTTFELVEHLKDNKDLGGIKGITYRKNGDIIHNQDRPFIKNGEDRYSELDIIPSPYLTGILNPEEFLNQNGNITVLTSRGCVFKCSYCNFSAMSKHTIRYHSIDRIISELKLIAQLRKMGKNFKVWIMDDTFTFNRKRVKELCERIIKEKIGLGFWAETRGDCLDKELLKLLFNAGVRDLDLGLESAVPRILYKMKKARLVYSKNRGFTPEKRYIQGIKDSVNLAKEIGMRVSVNVIFGFPGETLKEGLKTLNFVNRLKVDKCYHNLLKIYPGTELFESILTNTGPKSCKPIKKRRSLSFTYYSAEYYSEYDVAKLPRLYNEVFLNGRKDVMSFFLTRALMGMGRKVNYSYPEYIILMRDILPFEWIEKNSALQTRIAFGKNMQRFINHKDGNIEITIKSFAEIASLVSKKGDLDLKRLRKGNPNASQNYSFLKLSRFDRVSNERPKDSPVIFDIYDNEDIKELERQADIVKMNDTARFNTRPLPDCMILDGCRWSSNCPALQMKRLIVDNNGDIRVCFKGNVIGNIDTPLEERQKKLNSLIKKIEFERGCNLCPIKDRCSKCMFLGLITPDKYCSIMKNKPFINKFINLLNVAVTTKQMIDIRKRGI